jgi:hypothetical protein
MDESGRRAPGQGGGIGDPVQVDGVGDAPLSPDERPTYRTDQRAGDGEGDAPSASPGSEPRTWFVVGIALLLLFIAILIWAVIQPLI